MEKNAIASTIWSPDGFTLGCDYNPEQWPRETWVEDIRLMNELGINLVAINIFGWASLEPREGEYDFAALDDIIGLLHEAGIRINLGTGTSSPPPWLTRTYPGILPVADDGTTRWPGGRQAWCPSSPEFRSAALALTEQVASRYGNHPAIALWHVNNELGCHNAHCYCDASAAAFRSWLERRYGSIDELNAAWGTSFWSQRYTEWRDILPPRRTISAKNPSQWIDFCRFSSDELLGYFEAEAAIIREHSSAPVTTNFMVTAHIRNLDYWQWAERVDVVANDHYLDHRLEHPISELSFAADLTRGLAGGDPWILMEQATSAVSWQPRNIAKVPGEMMRNTMSHVARGADAICFFQWRASRQGSEKFHSALLPHAGTDSKIWREAIELSAALDSISGVVGSRVAASVALVFSWPSWWAAETDSMPSAAVKYLEQVHSAYEALRRSGVTVDIVAPHSDLSAYSAIVVPCLYLVSDADAANISSFVADGGSALFTFFSGVVDDTDGVRLGGESGPGAFSSVIGAWTEEYFPLRDDENVELSSGARGSIWSESVRTTTASAVDSFTAGHLAGSPAITRNTYGAGVAWYAATNLDEGDFEQLARTVLSSSGVPLRAVSPNVEVVARESATERFTFVINHSDAAVQLTIDGDELITASRVVGTLEVGPGLVRVVCSRKEDS